MAGGRKLALGLAVLLALSFSLAPARGQLRTSAKLRAARIQHLKEVERRIYRLTNEERRKKGLPSLDRDEGLVEIARLHTDDMLRRNFFSHVNPDGASPKDRIAPVYSNFISRAGENIWSGKGQDYSDSKLIARVIVDSWMTSPGHRANILNPEFTHLGVGVGVLDDQIRATQNFVTRTK